MNELIIQLLIVAYASVSAISIIGYLPTIKDLWHHKKMSSNNSSYLIWTATSAITLLYSLFILPDLLFRISSALNFVMCLTILILGLALGSSKTP